VVRQNKIPRRYNQKAPGCRHQGLEEVRLLSVFINALKKKIIFSTDMSRRLGIFPIFISLLANELPVDV
jgi:hypothetical protein